MSRKSLNNLEEHDVIAIDTNGLCMHNGGECIHQATIDRLYLELIGTTNELIIANIKTFIGDHDQTCLNR